MPSPGSSDGLWTPTQRQSLFWTFVVGVATVALAVWMFRIQSVLGTAVSVGAIGGFVHELAQSRGTLLFFRKTDEGIYIGMIGGMVLGAAAGMLMAKNFPSPVPTYPLIYDAFLAGVALKGIGEALSTASPPPKTDATNLDALHAQLPDLPTKPVPPRV